MISQEEDVDAHALRRQGMSISAIARHLGRDPKTIRAYLNGDRTPGQRKASGVDAFEPYAAYVAQRLANDPHVWAIALFDEVTAAGYAGSYPTFTRKIRDLGLRPACAPCAPTKGRASAVIAHPPGQEIQWDWVDLPDPPAHWGWGANAHVLIGALSHSGRWRGFLAPGMDQGHLVDGLDRITRELGGVPARWRFDRMAAVCHPDSGRVTASFAAVAKHYGAGVDICPPRRGNRKGVVEKAIHNAAQRWWRTLPDAVTVEQAQASLDGFCARVIDTRRRSIDGTRTSIAEHAATEMLRETPRVPYPATITEQRTVSAQALVAWRGNRYSVSPQLAHSTVVVAQRLGDPYVDITTTSGVVVARHALAPAGAGVMVRDDVHVAALEHAALAAFTTARPHRRKERIPISPEATALLPAPAADLDTHRDVVIDLAAYAAAAAGRNTLT
jgi:transposase